MNPPNAIHRTHRVALQLALPCADPADVLRQLSQTPLLRRRKPTQHGEEALDLDSPESLEWQPRDSGCTPPLQTTRWTVRQRQGMHVELALTTRHVLVGGLCRPVCQLEGVLLAGTPAALHGMAVQLAKTVPMLPSQATLAERCLALAQGAHTAQTTPTAKPDPGTSLPQLAQRVLSHMLHAFATHLAQLPHSDDPEVVHQARVAWRRFKSGIRLFKPVLPPDALPDWAPLEPLLSALGALRDQDVALTETLPPLQHAYTEDQAHRLAHWEALQQALAQASQTQRHTVRQALQNPAVGHTLLSTLQALCNMPEPAAQDEPRHAKHPKKALALQHWAQRRLARLHQRLSTATQTLGPLESQHRARILAKRLRYSTDALRTLLPKKDRLRWAQQASHWQTQLGTTRDVTRASTLAAEWGADAELVAFLRGVAVGQQMGGG